MLSSHIDILIGHLTHYFYIDHIPQVGKRWFEWIYNEKTMSTYFGQWRIQLFQTKYKCKNLINEPPKNNSFLCILVEQECLTNNVYKLVTKYAKYLNNNRMLICLKKSINLLESYKGYSINPPCKNKETKAQETREIFS